MSKDYISKAIEVLINNKLKEVTQSTKWAFKSKIVEDLLTAGSDTFNSIALDTTYYLAYKPIDPNSVVVYKESTSTYYQRYSDWNCNQANGTIEFLSTGRIITNDNIVVEYKYYLSSLNDVPEIYGQKIIVKEWIIKSGTGSVEIDEIRFNDDADNYIKEEIIFI